MQSPAIRCNQFQSAPRDCSRGDSLTLEFTNDLVAFQSAPRDCSRGDVVDEDGLAEKFEFQSAPRDCSRGDLQAVPLAVGLRCFNPHPVIAHGVTGKRAGI